MTEQILHRHTRILFLTCTFYPLNINADETSGSSNLMKSGQSFDQSHPLRRYKIYPFQKTISRYKDEILTLRRHHPQRADKNKLLRWNVSAKCHSLIKISSRVGLWKGIIPLEQPARVQAAREIYPQITGPTLSRARLTRDRVVERDLNRRRRRRRTFKKQARDTDNTSARPLNCPRDERRADKRASSTK